MPPPLSKLLAVAPEELRALQLELNPNVAYELAAKDLARDVYAGQHGSGLTVYHGSPHQFTPTEMAPHGEFDFLGNLSRGEGAQAYGPGGYLTGDRDLARYYAETLAKRAAERMPSGRPLAPRPQALLSYTNAPDAWVAGAKADYPGFLEFLRARSVAKALGDYQSPSNHGSGRSFVKPLMDSLQRPDAQSYNIGRSVEYYPPDQLALPSYQRGRAQYSLLHTTVAHPGLAQYREALLRTPPASIRRLSDRLTNDSRGAEAADIGAQIRERLKQAGLNVDDPRATPLGIQVRSEPAGRVDSYSEIPDTFRNYNKGEGALSLLRRQMAAVRDAELEHTLPEGVARGWKPSTYKASMDESVDLGMLSPRRMTPEALAAVQLANDNIKRSNAQRLAQYQADLAAWEAGGRQGPKPQPHIYTAQTSLRPSDMFSYDLPLSSTSPRVLGALSRVAAEAGVHSGPPEAIARALSTQTGNDLIRQLSAKLGPEDTVKTLRDASVPAMYFRRNGHRVDFENPQFDPSQYNFVWFDDPALRIVNRENKATGGRV